MTEQYNELYDKLAQLQWLLKRHHMMEHAHRGPLADTSRGQGRVLAMLKIQPEISTKDLSYLLGIRVPSLNELLIKLEKNDYIIRKPSPQDRRVMIIHLTEKGRATPQEETDRANIFDCLSKSEQETLGEYLDRVIAALESQIGTDDAREQDERSAWFKEARSRMDGDMLAQMMSMRGGFPPHHPGPRPNPPHPHHDGGTRFDPEEYPVELDDN